MNVGSRCRFHRVERTAARRRTELARDGDGRWELQLHHLLLMQLRRWAHSRKGWDRHDGRGWRRDGDDDRRDWRR